MKNNGFTVAYIGGGSMNFGWKFISQMCQTPNTQGVVRLYDIDKPLALANEIIAGKALEAVECQSEVIFISMESLEQTLRGADYVIISISSGTIEEQISDISIPENYGIFQTSGDNLGAGGIMKAVRTVPAYAEIAKGIEMFCPNAFVISLTEPMSTCMKTLYQVFPKINAIGSSNDVFAVKELLAQIVSDEYDEEVSSHDIKINIIGINKFSFVDSVLYNGEDVTYLYKNFVNNYIKNGYTKLKNKIGSTTYFVQSDFYLRYGIISAVEDKYLAENCGSLYLSTQKTMQNWKLSTQPVVQLKRNFDEKIIKCKRLVKGDERLSMNVTGTDCINQITALEGLGNLLTNAVTINRGQIQNLPIGSIVETNGLFSHNHFIPVFAGEIPKNIKPLVERQIANTNLLVDAILDNDLDQIFNVFLNDSMMNLDISKATALFKDLLKANSEHIMKIKKNVSEIK